MIMSGTFSSPYHTFISCSSLTKWLTKYIVHIRSLVLLIEGFLSITVIDTNPSISRREKKDDINHFVIDPHESAGAGRGLIEYLVIGAGMSTEKVCTIHAYQRMSYFVLWLDKYLSG